MRRYLQGQGVRVETAVPVTDVDGNPVTSGVTLVLQKPDGTQVTFSSPDADGGGLFHQDLSAATDLTQLGSYLYQWVVTGTGEGVSDPGGFNVVIGFKVGGPLAAPSDVAAVWRVLSAAEIVSVTDMIEKASALLRQKCPFDIDERITRFDVDPSDPLGLDPVIVAVVVANIVKRVAVNPDGILSGSQTAGPYSQSQVFASRTSDSGDSGSGLRVTPADIDQLRPAAQTALPSTFRLKPPHHFRDPCHLHPHWIAQ